MRILAIVTLIICSTAGALAGDLSLSAQLARTENVYKVRDGNDSSSLDFSLNPAWKINDSYTLSALIDGSQDLKKEEFDFGRTQATATYTKGFDFAGADSKLIKMVPTLTAIYPGSKIARSASLQGGLVVGSTFALAPTALPSTKWGLGLTVNIRKNFHQFETTVEGKGNSEWSSVNPSIPAMISMIAGVCWSRLFT